MSFRFRRSIRIAPGVKINLNKKSVGITVGRRGMHHTINSKGRQTTSVGIPGTGLSYQHVSTPKTRKPNLPKSAPVPGSTALISRVAWGVIVACVIIVILVLATR